MESARKRASDATPLAYSAPRQSTPAHRKYKSEFYVLEYPDWINVIAITDDGRFVMEHQYRHGLGETCIELCAGVMEEGETPEQAARRELEEETGYVGGTWTRLMTISGNPSTTDNLTYCFIAQGVTYSGARHLDRTEDIEVVLMTPDEVYSLLLNDEMKQALMAAAVALLRHDAEP